MDGGNNFPACNYSGAPQDTRIMNRIMLRFRPIAPKPVAPASYPGSVQESDKIELGSKRRAKRKYVRVKKNTISKNNEPKGRENNRSLQFGDSESTVLTLQLLPESSSSSVKNPLESTGSFQKTINFWKSEDNDILTVGSADRIDRTVEMEKRRVIESWVMVDKITNTLVDGEALGCTDMEKMKNLEADTCPGMISDGLDKVTWVNLAYRRMVDPVEASGTTPELVTWLVIKDRINMNSINLQAFACTVRIVYMKQSQIMPCDVWKMDYGGFAWRFDANAALSLGR